MIDNLNASHDVYKLQLKNHIKEIQDAEVAFKARTRKPTHGPDNRDPVELQIFDALKGMEDKELRILHLKN